MTHLPLMAPNDASSLHHLECITPQQQKKKAISSDLHSTDDLHSSSEFRWCDSPSSSLRRIDAPRKPSRNIEDCVPRPVRRHLPNDVPVHTVVVVKTRHQREISQLSLPAVFASTSSTDWTDHDHHHHDIDDDDDDDDTYDDHHYGDRVELLPLGNSKHSLTKNASLHRSRHRSNHHRRERSQLSIPWMDLIDLEDDDEDDEELTYSDGGYSFLSGHLDEVSEVSSRSSSCLETERVVNE